MLPDITPEPIVDVGDEVQSPTITPLPATPTLADLTVTLNEIIDVLAAWGLITKGSP